MVVNKTIVNKDTKMNTNPNKTSTSINTMNQTSTSKANMITKLRLSFIPTLILGSTLSLILSFLLNLTLSPTSFAAPTTFTVTNTNDSGAGSLRQAIEDANSNGNPGDQDIINFNIPGFGDQVIEPASNLTITQSVLIDGYTQSDAEENTDQSPNPFTGFLRIELNLINSGAIVVSGSNVTLKGLAINRAPEDSYGLHAINAHNLKIYGNYFNVDTTGLIRRGYQEQKANIYIENSNNVEIGGSQPERRNIISWCDGACIEAFGSGGQHTNNLKIQGNFISVGADAVSDQGLEGTGISLKEGVTNAVIGGNIDDGEGNSIMHNLRGGINAEDVDGLSISGNRILANNTSSNDVIFEKRQGAITLGGSKNVVIGGNNHNKRNIISGQNGCCGDYNASGIILRNSVDTNDPTHDVSIENNYIGVIDDGTTPYENIGTGVAAVGGSYDVLIKSNIIRNSYSMSGVVINDTARKIAVMQNSIYNNQGIGIDIGYNNNHNSNDPNDSDSGPNDMLNSPGYTQIVEDGGNTEVDFSIDVPAGNYRIEFFSNTVAGTSGIGEGETYLGHTNITSDGNGLQEFSHTLSGTGHTNLALTATEIDPDTPSGFGSTSEFGGAGQTVTPDASDLQIRKTLLNPQDYATGNTLDYQITIRNNGPLNFDVSNLDDPDPSGGKWLFQDILPPNLTYSSVSGDAQCIYLGDGFAQYYGPVLANHSTYGIAVCAYDGASPRVLEAGDSISFTIHATVTNDADPDFTNYALVNMFYDVDNGRFTDCITNGLDILDCGTGVSGMINNTAAATSAPTDISIEKTLNNPQDVTPGETLDYTLTFTNNGPSTLDPTQFNLGGMNPMTTLIFADFMPPNLSFVASSNPDVACTDVGPAGGSRSCVCRSC